MKRFAVLAICLLFPFAAVSEPASTFPGGLQMIGEGVLKLQPDQAEITVSAQTENPELATAKKLNDEKLRKLFKIASGHGIAKDDMRTSYANVQPVYDYSKDSNKPILRGYSVNATLEFTVKSLDKLPGFMDAIVKSGIDQIQNVQFSLQNPQEAQEDALILALENARGKAERMAKAIGITLGRVVQVNETGQSYAPIPMPMYRGDMMMKAEMASSAPPALPGGLIEVRQTVTVLFALN